MALRSGDEDAILAAKHRRCAGSARRRAGHFALFLLPFQQAAQPVDLLRTAGVGWRPVPGAVGFVLVGPMGAHAEFAFLVHGAGADLHFQRLAGWPDHGGVDGTVAVGFGIGDVVVELAGNRRPGSVNDPQHAIAGIDVRHEYAHGLHVVHVLDADGLVAHLVPDAVDVLGAALDFGVRDAGGG